MQRLKAKRAFARGSNYHSNSLSRNQCAKHGNGMAGIPCALGEEIVLAIHMDHAVFQDALPLIFYTGNLWMGNPSKEVIIYVAP
jgi:hypothetical protein